MGTVTITGVSPNPNIYGADLAAATTYITARFGSTYDAWLALATTDLKGRTLVSATDYIDRLGLKDTSGAAIPYTTSIVAVQQACFELAVLINSDPDLVTAIDASSNVKRVGAGGGVEVEYFNPTSTKDGSASTLPWIVQQLLAPYLPVPSVTVIGGYGQAGDCPCDDDDDLSRSGPY